MMYKRLSGTPAYMHGAVLRYIEQGIPPGSFLTALFSNDLMDAYGRADENNLAAMRSWVQYIYDNAPCGCHGSRERVEAWMEQGGLFGIEKREQRRAEEAQAEEDHAAYAETPNPDDNDIPF